MRRRALRPQLAAAVLWAPRCLAHVRGIATRGSGSGSGSGIGIGIGIGIVPVGGATAAKPRPLPVPQRRPGAVLAGKTAIVTGGSRGIGWAVAYRLALEGVTCTLVGRDEAALQRAVAALPRPPPLQASAGPAGAAAGASGGPGRPAAAHRYMAGDVRDPSLWGALFVTTPEAHLLVNAAGVTHSTVLVRMTPAEIRDVLDVNLYGTIAGCRAALRAWLKTRSADRCIINIGSLLAVRGGYGATVYAASKAGVVGLTRALAEEGGARRIRANVILPGYIETDMTANLPEQQLTEAKNRIPLKRFGTPDEVADAALFLAKNDYANNCVLNLDGGLSAAA